MKRLLLAGGGQAHALVLREIARRRLTGVEIVLVTPSSRLRYSGMLPGWIAGHYALEELTIDIAPLARAAGARCVTAQVQKLDLANRIAFTDRGEALEFDRAVDRHRRRNRRRSDQRRSRTCATAATIRRVSSPVGNASCNSAEAARETFRLTVIGGGAGGAETALAAAYRARAMPSPVQVQLLTGGVPILPGHGHRARGADDHRAREERRAGDRRRRSVRRTGGRCHERRSPAGNGCHVDRHRRIGVEVAARHWTDTRRPRLCHRQLPFAIDFASVRVRSRRHCHADRNAATEVGGVCRARGADACRQFELRPRPGEPLSAFKPQRRALYLLTTGPKHAIASWGALACAGRWVWHWKDRIDRDYITKCEPVQ